MSNRVLIVAAAILFSVAPALANGIHSDKGASGQGLESDAHFEPGTTVNGVSVTPFFNDNAGNTLDENLEIFQIPADFTSGTDYILTFSDITLGYGIFDCNNGSNNFAVSEDTPPVDIGSTCTVGTLDSNDPFVNFDESGNTATISFLGGAGAPSTFYFWTPETFDANGNPIGNLLSIEAVSANAPEPASLLLLACGLIGVVLFRRRLAVS
jgi:hypothetical protein